MLKIVSFTLVLGLLLALGIKGLSEHNQAYTVISFGIMFFLATEHL